MRQLAEYDVAAMAGGMGQVSSRRSSCSNRRRFMGGPQAPIPSRPCRRGGNAAVNPPTSRCKRTSINMLRYQCVMGVQSRSLNEPHAPGGSFCPPRDLFPQKVVASGIYNARSFVSGRAGRMPRRLVKQTPGYRAQGDTQMPKMKTKSRPPKALQIHRDRQDQDPPGRQAPPVDQQFAGPHARPAPKHRPALRVRNPACQALDASNT